MHATISGKLFSHPCLPEHEAKLSYKHFVLRQTSVLDPNSQQSLIIFISDNASANQVRMQALNKSVVLAIFYILESALRTSAHFSWISVRASFPLFIDTIFAALPKHF